MLLRWAALCCAVVGKAALPPEVTAAFQERIWAWDDAEQLQWKEELRTSRHLGAPEVLRAGVEGLPAQLGGRGSAIALGWGHDASIAVGINGRVQCVLELERWFNTRYYESWRLERFDSDWLSALEAVRDRCQCENGPCPREFDTAVMLSFPTDPENRDLWKRLHDITEQVFTIRSWSHCSHHLSHALMAYYSSPFRSAAIISYDGGGDDGLFNVYVGIGDSVHRVARLDYNMGDTYAFLGGLLPEVTGEPQILEAFCEPFLEDMATGLLPPEGWSRFTGRYALKSRLAFSGKLMGYAATGKKNDTLTFALLEFFDYHTSHYGRQEEEKLYDAVPNILLEAACGPIESQRDMAASIQVAFDAIAMSIVRPAMVLIDTAVQVEGIVVTGGCALNVITNQLFHDELTSNGGRLAPKEASRAPREVYSPPAANDAGLTVGALWSVFPPLQRQSLQYLGFPLWDAGTLESTAYRRGAHSLEALGGVDYLAELLAGGPAWQRDPHRRTSKPIIAIVRGRQEFGPRALGHRSLVAVPDSDEMRDRMNALKHRQWYRPVAPMIADEAMGQVFNRTVKSAYMTMAPVVTEDVRKRFPGMVHLDGTARHQSVGREDEPFVHALLLAVARWTGLAALINTSFNSKGAPICNTARESLKMLDELPELDLVLIDDWLFRAPPRD